MTHSELFLLFILTPNQITQKIQTFNIVKPDSFRKCPKYNSFIRFIFDFQDIDEHVL